MKFLWEWLRHLCEFLFSLVMALVSESRQREVREGHGIDPLSVKKLSYLLLKTPKFITSLSWGGMEKTNRRNPSSCVSMGLVLEAHHKSHLDYVSVITGPKALLGNYLSLFFSFSFSFFLKKKKRKRKVQLLFKTIAKQLFFKFSPTKNSKLILPYIALMTCYYYSNKIHNKTLYQTIPNCLSHVFILEWKSVVSSAILRTDLFHLIFKI